MGHIDSARDMSYVPLFVKCIRKIIKLDAQHQEQKKLNSECMVTQHTHTNELQNSESTKLILDLYAVITILQIKTF